MDFNPAFSFLYSLFIVPSLLRHACLHLADTVGFPSPHVNDLFITAGVPGLWKRLQISLNRAQEGPHE